VTSADRRYAPAILLSLAFLACCFVLLHHCPSVEHDEAATVTEPEWVMLELPVRLLRATYYAAEGDRHSRRYPAAYLKDPVCYPWTVGEWGFGVAWNEGELGDSVLVRYPGTGRSARVPIIDRTDTPGVFDLTGPLFCYLSGGELWRGELMVEVTVSKGGK